MLPLLRRILTLWACFAGSHCLPAQTVTTFHATYSFDVSSAYGALSNVIVTADGGYAFPAMVNGPDFDSVNLTLIKTRNDGTIDWMKKLNTSSRLWYFSANTNSHLIQLSGGGYAMEALVRPANSTDDPSLVVFRLDAAANVLWESSFTGDFRQSGTLMETNDGGLIVTGTIFDAVKLHDYWMAKLDASGNSLWSREYDFNQDEDYLNAATYTTGGDVILAGAAELSQNMDMGIIRTDGNGNVTWMNRYDASVHDMPLDMKQTSAGDFILTGRSMHPVSQMWDIFGVRMDANGGIMWSYMYGGNLWDEGYGVTEAGDGGFVFACEPESFSGGAESCLMKTDALGNFEWMKRFGSPFGTFPSAVTRAPDNGFVLTGVQFGPPLLYLVKTDERGNTSCITDSVVPMRTNMPLTVTPAGNNVPSMAAVTMLHGWSSAASAPYYRCEPAYTSEFDTLFIPNVFTPNGSPPNDFFQVIYAGNEPYHLLICDRWGVPVYETGDKNDYWDGKTRDGKDASAGTYYYVLEIGERSYTGFLTLLR